MTPNTRRSPTQIETELLVLDAQSGSRAALEALIARSIPMLAHHALQRTNDHDGAADVLQESLLAVARSLGRLDDPAAFPAWAVSIVARKSADWIRKRTLDRRTQDTLAERARGDLRAERSTDADPDDRAAVRAAVSTLPETHRLVVVLHYSQGFTVEQIALLLGLRPGTVKSRLHNARAKLRAALDPGVPSVQTTEGVRHVEHR